MPEKMAKTTSWIYLAMSQYSCQGEIPGRNFVMNLGHEIIMNLGQTRVKQIWLHCWIWTCSTENILKEGVDIWGTIDYLTISIKDTGN